MKCCQLQGLRHKCIEGASLEGKEVKNTIVITFAFQVVFTGYNALQNLHSSLHDEESLGNICLAIMSGTAIISSVLSPTIIGLIGAKTSIVAFFAAHSIYVLANFYPSFSTMAPAAIAVGAFQGPAWTSQALYISASAFSFSKSSSASPYSILSRFNGFFFAVYATSEILGNLVTSTVIKDGAGNTTDDLSFFRYCGPDDCPSNENATSIEDPEDWVLDITLGFFMACALFGLILTVFLLTPLPHSEWIQRVSVRSTTTSCFNVLVSTNMILLVPFIIFTAAEHGFLLSAFTKSYVACPIGLHMVGYVMAVYGATTPVFVFIFSRLAKIAGRFILLTLAMTTHIILLIILFQWSPTADDMAVIFTIPVVWGVSECLIQAQANSLIAMLYPTQKEPAFANFHAWRSLGFTITFLNATFMCVSTKLIVCMSFGAIGLILYIVVELRTKVKEKQAFKRPRQSVESNATIPSDVELRQEGTQASVSSNRTSVSSLQSVQDRLSFDRVELTDIIMEAQRGWSRDEDGLTLEINRVMSQEHLANSKVTNWYHNTPVISDFTNKATSGQSSHKPGLPRSLSDTQLHYAAVKVDAALFKMRRERSHTIGTGLRSQTNATPLPKRRHLSDINPPNFHVIREIVYEVDELEYETESDFHIAEQSIKDDSDNVFEHDDDDIDEEEPREFMHYTKFIRRLSETLKKDNFGQIGHLKKEIDDDRLSEVSGSSSIQDNQSIQSEDDDEQYKRGIVFTLGSTASSIGGHYNSAFESDDNDDNTENNSTYNITRRMYRSISSDNGSVASSISAARRMYRSDSNENGSVVSNTSAPRRTHRSISSDNGSVASTNTTPRRISRSISSDNGHVSSSKPTRRSMQRSISSDDDKHNEETGNVGPMVKGFHRPRRVKSTSDTAQVKDKKRKVFKAFKGQRLKKKKKNDSISSSNAPSKDSVRDPGGSDVEVKNDSDADSDGFVNYEHDDNENYLTNGITDIGKFNRRRKIPVCETEDITVIY